MFIEPPLPGAVRVRETTVRARHLQHLNVVHEFPAVARRERVEGQVRIGASCSRLDNESRADQKKTAREQHARSMGMYGV